MNLLNIIMSIMLSCSSNSDISNKCAIEQSSDSMKIYLCGDEYDFGVLDIGIVNINNPNEVNIIEITTECNDG